MISSYSGKFPTGEEKEKKKSAPSGQSMTEQALAKAKMWQSKQAGIKQKAASALSDLGERAEAQSGLIRTAGRAGVDNMRQQAARALAMQGGMAGGQGLVSSGAAAMGARQSALESGASILEKQAETARMAGKADIDAAAQRYEAAQTQATQYDADLEKGRLDQESAMKKINNIMASDNTDLRNAQLIAQLKGQYAGSPDYDLIERQINQAIAKLGYKGRF